MGIPYTPTIPATNDDPANDQPLMQQNFSSINTWINIDHVGFSNASYGEHNQVTFANVTSPATPSNPASILYTKNDIAGNPQINFINSSAFANVASGKGCVLLLGGIILQWGGTGVISGSGNVITFATAFPNNCYVVTLTLTDPGNPAVNYNVQEITKANFKCATSSTNKSFYYIAIGN